MKHKAYMLVYKPSKCKCWTLLHGNENRWISEFYKHNTLVFVKFAYARRIAGMFNWWKMKLYLKGDKEWDVLRFKVATLTW